MTGNKIIKIFLASSSELKDERKQFEIFINRKNKEYIRMSIFLELVMWEDFLDAMSPTRLQDEYNKAIANCDVFVSLFHTKVGQYTEEEFLKALATFQTNKRPLIYTYFKDSPILPSQAKQMQSIFDFQDKLSKLGHFYKLYKNIDELKYLFDQQLTKFIPKLTDIQQEKVSTSLDIKSENLKLTFPEQLMIPTQEKEKQVKPILLPKHRDFLEQEKKDLEEKISDIAIQMGFHDPASIEYKNLKKRSEVYFSELQKIETQLSGF